MDTNCNNQSSLTCLLFTGGYIRQLDKPGAVVGQFGYSLVTMELKFPLPRVTTITAVTNIYLLLSLTAVQVYATHKPEQVTSSDNHQDQGDTDQSDITKVGDIVEVAQVREIPENYILSFSKLGKRSLDSYYYYDDEDFFRPSVKFESNKELPSLKKSSFANSHGYRDRQRHSNAHAQPNRNNSPRLVIKSYCNI